MKQCTFFKFNFRLCWIVISLFLSINFGFGQFATPMPITPLQDGDKVLFLGNSFTEWSGPLHSTLLSLLKASGANINITMNYKVKGMGILKQYATWSSLGMIAEIQKGGWKYVVVQGWNDAINVKDSPYTEQGVPITDYVGWPQCQDTMLTYLKVIDAEVRKIGATTILYEPHVNAYAYTTDLIKSNSTYAKLKNNVSCFHAPIVQAWDSIRHRYPVDAITGKSIPGSYVEKLYAPDCGHQNSNGMVLDAMTFYTIFTRRSAATLTPVLPNIMQNPELYEELASVAYKTGKSILEMNNCGFTDTEAPTIPQNIQAMNILSDSYNISWTASADNLGVLGYKVFKNDELIGTTAIPKFAIGGLSPETTYTMKVQAFDSEGNKSDYSTELNVKTPANLIVDNTGVLMSWDFKTVNGAASAATTKIMGGISGTAPSAVVSVGTKFVAGTFRSDALSMRNQDKSTLLGAISAQQYITFTIQPQIDNKMSISSIQLRPFTQNQKRNFTLMSSIAGFSDGNELQTIVGDGQNGTALQTISIIGHDNISTAIEFRIYVWGPTNPWESFGIGAGDGGTSVDDMVISGNVKSSPLPLFPTNLTFSDLSETGFALNWNEAKNAAKYEIFKNGVTVGTTTSLSMVISDVTIGSTYTMTVKAIDGLGILSEESVPLDVKIIDSHVPSTPQNLTVTNITPNSFILHWDASTDNVGVTLYEISMDGSTYGNTADNYLPVPFLTPNKNYSMTVRSKDAAGNVSPFSSVINVSTTSTGIDTNVLNFDIYPNPASTYIDIESNSDKQIVKISDLQGKTMLLKSVFGPKNSISLKDFKAGLYVIEICSDQFTIYKKMVVKK